MEVANSMPNLTVPVHCESESSLNPLASEFVPSHLQSPFQNGGNRVSSRSQDIKSEATSTTTLVPQVLSAPDFLHAQRQLYELLHQLGNKLMPLKAINVSLEPDGLGVNVKFTTEQVANKKMLDLTICQNCALNFEMIEPSFMPRRLPNVLTANFLARMGEVLNDKMELFTGLEGDSSLLNQTTERVSSTSLAEEINTLSSSIQNINRLIHKKPTHLVPSNLNGVRDEPYKDDDNLSRPISVSKIPAPVSGSKRFSRIELRQRPGVAVKSDTQHE